MTYHSLVYLKAVIGHEEKRLNDEPDATAKSSGLSQTGSEPQLLNEVAAPNTWCQFDVISSAFE